MVPSESMMLSYTGAKVRAHLQAGPEKHLLSLFGLVPSRKCLLYKHQDLSFISRACLENKRSQLCCHLFVVLVLGRQSQEDPWDVS